VHHSSRHMNVSVAVRFGPLEGVISALFHLPLVFLGFPPVLIFSGILAVLAYQTWIHTELIGKLGILDDVLNTPSNHRVHHGCDDKYIDKNYGGILIIWDRMFGTFQREEERPHYGLKRDFDSVNPIHVWFSELPQFYKDLRNSRSLSEIWMRLFGRPGWAPKTSKENLKQS
ncbi:MAG: sterol desaturase family protein, partial [Pseudomonadota bacterium]